MAFSAMPDERSISRRRHAPKGPIKTKHPMDAEHLMGVQRCSAQSKQSGQRCKRAVVPGARVCHYHGGAAPQVKEAADERLRALLYPAIQTLAELIDLKEFPTVRLGASKDILDRTMGTPKQTLKLESPSDLSDEELDARLEALRTRKK